MGASQQRKGRRAELELAERLRGYGYPIEAAPPLNFGGVPDLVGLAGIHIECKRRECPDVMAALRQAEADAAHFGDGTPVVFWRRNRGTVFMSLESFVELYRFSPLCDGKAHGKA